MTNIVLAKKKVINISVNATAGIINTTNPVTLKNTPSLLSEPATRLDKLLDVYANNEIDGATLVYDSGSDKYKVEKLSLDNVIGALDGGDF